MIDTIQWRPSIGGFNISVRSAYIDNKVRCDSPEFMEYEVPWVVIIITFQLYGFCQYIVF